MPDWISQFIPKGADQALEFMVAFGRFEYALKTFSHFDGTSSISWKHVPARLDRITKGNGFYAYVAERAPNRPDLDYLLKRPAKALTVRNGRIEWDEDYEVRSTDDLIWAMKNTRNNLFHGGKYHPGDDWDRNLSLIRGSMQVIELILEVDPELGKAFWGD